MNDLQDELRKLQNEMAEIDLYTRSRIDGVIELLVKKYRSIRLRIDLDHNHQRPHIHVDYGRDFHAASYCIESGERLAGVLDRKYDRSIRKWVEEHREKLLKVWNSCKDNGPSDALIAELRESEFG